MTKILLDLDGVCCDFSNEFYRRAKRDDLVHFSEYGKSTCETAGLSTKDFWKLIDSWGIDFWQNIPEYPWFRDLYSEVNKFGDVYFCTRPSLDPSSAYGKYLWIKSKFGKHFKNIILINDKELLSQKGTFLVDDTGDNVLKFNEGKGNGILFPMPWNTRGENDRNVGQKVEKVIREIKMNLLLK
jgi:5'(3')-deoxyribonucleotidase